MSKTELLSKLADLAAGYLKAAEESKDAGSRSYRAGLSDGFHIASLLAKDLDEKTGG